MGMSNVYVRRICQCKCQTWCEPLLTLDIMGDRYYAKHVKERKNVFGAIRDRDMGWDFRRFMESI